MSGLLLITFIMAGLAASLAAPVICLYLYTYVTYMAPHTVFYGPGMTLPLAMITGAGALAIWAALDRKVFTQLSWCFYLLLLWLIWVCITFQFYQGDSFNAHFKFDYATKILAFTLLAILMLTTRRRIEGFIVILCVAVGFYVGRGLVVTALTGGGGLSVTGNKSTPLGDRNYFATVVWMLIPMLIWLSQHSRLFPQGRLLKIGAFGFIAAGLTTIVGTQSRGAMLGAPIFFGFLFLQTRRKLSLIVAGAVLVAGGLFLAPAEWFERMNTIQEYDEDKSANSRFNSWTFAWEFALKNPVFGGGFRIFTLNVDPIENRWLDAHSIYFEVLAEHGFPGLAIFLVILAAVFLNGRYLARICKPHPELAWAGDLGHKLTISITLYAVCGALLSLAFHPILYDFFAVSIALRHVVHRHIAAKATGPGLAGKDAPGGGDPSVAAHAPDPRALSWRERRELKLQQEAAPKPQPETGTPVPPGVSADSDAPQT